MDEFSQYYHSPENIFAAHDMFANENLFTNENMFANENLFATEDMFPIEDIFTMGEEGEVCPANRSAFVRYEAGPAEASGGKCNYRNVNKRMIEFTKRRWNPVVEGMEYERERCRRHMINERMRREKQKNSYSSLRSHLPPGTKSDKNSIIQVAAKEVKELQRNLDELERRNREIETFLAERERRKNEGALIKLRVANPISGVDSMVEVLKCLKRIGSTTAAIQSQFSAQELSAVLEIPENGAAEVEKAVQRTLFEVERKLHFHYPN